MSLRQKAPCAVCQRAYGADAGRGLPAAAQAQTTSASVSGTVQDAQGGVLPGVAVTLTSRTQGNAPPRPPTPKGASSFAIVRPDTYTLTAELQGFKTLERTNLVVNANDRLSAGILALEVGAMTEEVTVSTRVSELQTTSGERSFALENSALQNIANNGRMLFNFAVLVPGAVPQGNGGQEIGSVSGFTVNGQRPNSNNDVDRRRRQHRHRRQRRQHGDDQHRRRRRVQGADQRLPGRVRPRGRRPAPGGDQERLARLPRLRLLVRPPVRLERQQLDQQAQRRETPKAKTSRNDGGYTIGGPIFVAGLQRGQEEAVLLLQPGAPAPQSRTTAERQTRVPTALERQGDFSQSVDSSGNRFNLIRDYQTGLPCSATDTRGCFQDGGVLGKIPANRLYAPGIGDPEHLPGAELQRRRRPQLREPGAEQHAAP